jgi:ketosteroid isomerase-like protein
MRNSRDTILPVRLLAPALAVFLILAVSANTSTGQDQKNKKNKNANPPAATPSPSTPDTDQIDHDIGEMLAAFELGKVDMLHKYYSDNVTMVSGEYAPPIIGWAAYAPLFQKQWAMFQSMQLNRRNTLIFTHGDFAWATYQWQFDSSLNGQAYSRHGQTTLVFNKVGDSWLIVHNHTSVIDPEQAQQAAPAGSKP